MTDDGLFSRIDELVAEEHRLENGSGLTDAERERLREIEVALDQCWDLLRQRRAARSSGADPSAAHVRDAGTVEGYQQ